MAFLIVKLVAGICAISAIIVALVHIFNHLRNYTEPTYQRYTVRIIFMVPVYAAMSYLSLLMPDKSIYFDSFRDIYEAWVIYNFMSLCLAWVGGPGAVVTSLAGRFLKPSWHLMTCCFPAIPLDGRFIRRCKQGCLQFVILKPLMAIATLWMYFKEKYSDGSFKASSGSLYVTLIYTASYTTALCALLLFYFACKELLRPFKPLPKFIIIKSVVFLTYWQGVFVGLMVSFGMIRSESDSADLQNFLICMEMLAAAIGHLYAFPYKEYAEANVGSSGGLLSSISHAINFNDVVHDTMHQFAPTYHNYVLYSDGSQEAPTKYRARTFVKTGQEMETLRSNRNIGQSSKLDEGAYSSGLSSSEGGSPVKGDAVQNHGFRPGETFKNALLTDEQFAHAYDMSPLDVSSGHSKVAQYISPDEPSGHSKAPQYNPPEAQSGHSKAAQYNSPNAPSGPSKPPQYNSAASSGNFDPRNHIVVDFDPRKHTKPDGNQQTPRSSGLDSRRRSSTGEDAFEETRLTDRRRSSHGVLMEEIDYVGEEQAYHEGYVQQ